MPSAQHIYEHHADRYDELVAAEDHRGHLASCLGGLADWDQARVLEAGVGTGRVSKIYLPAAARAVCCDRSRHMLDYAQRALSEWKSKTHFVCCDNLVFPQLTSSFDVFVQGWSFGHSVTPCQSESELRDVTNRLVATACDSVRPGGVVILIETLGTFTEAAKPPHPNLEAFYSLLESGFGFERQDVRTDYRFRDVKTARRVMGFFFGEKMGDHIEQRGDPIVREWTGVWARSMPG